MKHLIFDFHEDCGHAWLKVSKKLFNKTNASIEHISQFSYEDKNNYYLEEDCDAALLINALKNKNIQYEIEDDHSNYDSFIRSLPNVKGVR